MTRCPCRTIAEAKPYARCCGPYHEGRAIPDTPVALMRSRYSAYALQSRQYLLDTWHASTRPADLSLERATEWLSLKVHTTTVDGDNGTVAFTAKLRENGKVGTLSETSRFVREDGRWFYVDGAVS
ncbi:MAG: hypothetical protein RL291_1926 [Pseudomonadota bacterium]